MSSRESVPQYLIAKTGEQISLKFLNWVSYKKKALIKAAPRCEISFMRVIDKLKSRLPKWRRRLHYNRQKYFIVSPHVVFFGDFYFRNLKMLIEIDGLNHLGEIAKEKDEWRTKLISAWNVKTFRLTNAEIDSWKFQEVEEWFIDRVKLCSPSYVRYSLQKDYCIMKKECPDLYDTESVEDTRISVRFGRHYPTPYISGIDQANQHLRSIVSGNY